MYPEIGCVDVNADLGEEITDDNALLEVVTSANVACGFHAGDEAVMRAVCGRAAELGVVIGAQVSYADREGFGRRPMDPGSAVLTGWVRDQVQMLSGIAAAAGTAVRYVKAHGALYNRAAEDEEQALALLAGSGDLPVLGLPGSTVLRLAQEQGRTVVAEGFPDRRYAATGRLVARSEPGALVEGSEQVAANAVRLARTGRIGTVCVHGDSPGAVATAYAVRDGLVRAGFEVRAWAD